MVAHWDARDFWTVRLCGAAVGPRYGLGQGETGRRGVRGAALVTADFKACGRRPSVYSKGRAADRG